MIKKDFKFFPERRDCDNCPKGQRNARRCPYVNQGVRIGKGFDCGKGLGEKCCWNHPASSGMFKLIIEERYGED